MPLTVDNSQALLSGIEDMTNQPQQRVEVISAFYRKNEVVGVGSVTDLPMSTAIELRSAKKVIFVAPDAKPKVSKKIEPPAEANPDPVADPDAANTGKGPEK